MLTVEAIFQLLDHCQQRFDQSAVGIKVSGFAAQLRPVLLQWRELHAGARPVQPELIQPLRLCIALRDARGILLCAQPAMFLQGLKQVEAALHYFGVRLLAGFQLTIFRAVGEPVAQYEQHDQQGQKNEGGIAHRGSLVRGGREERSNSPAICRRLCNAAQRD